MVGLFIGGGDRSRGDTGQRGASLISDVIEGFWGTGARIVGSDCTGCRAGIDAADRALCVAAAEGGFVCVLDERDGLTSCTLFFLDRPGPVERAVDELDLFSEGRTGEDSLEGRGLLAALGVGVRLG